MPFTQSQEEECKREHEACRTTEGVGQVESEGMSSSEKGSIEKVCDVNQQTTSTKRTSFKLLRRLRRSRRVAPMVETGKYYDTNDIVDRHLLREFEKLSSRSRARSSIK